MVYLSQRWLQPCYLLDVPSIESRHSADSEYTLKKRFILVIYNQHSHIHKTVRALFKSTMIIRLFYRLNFLALIFQFLNFKDGNQLTNANDSV